ELVSLAVLLSSGLVMIYNNNLLEQLLNGDTNLVVELLGKKLILVAFLIVLTVIHIVIAFRTNNKDRTTLENFISRGSSLLIFFINLFVLHYAIMIRSILS
ncbi:MAG: hypothetical protein Q9M34_07110, partial [Sulfurimonas sp.]|nr:hypothetical protein [Sulfurimonas sp.]